MVETTQLNKFRQKRLKGLAKKIKATHDKPYFYPKNNLYTRQEFELLDTIYSDEPPIAVETNQGLADFWPQNKEEYLSTSNNKNNILTNLLWFLCGVMLTSVIWLIYFQVNVNELRTKNDTQIVFQKSVNIMTDKSADKEMSKKLNVQKQKFSFSNPFKSKPKLQEIKVTPKELPVVRYHTVGNGDSLWVIANKYYSNPSPENINKIMKANNMKKVGLLSIGQKLVIPD
ncbi:MAG: LysM peptidoglycan-binding domain-containing protein [Candidatus Melainabacteria bacterium]|nr:LysM peptidoglycan-binding domain-containing protein [Candidatus Melainabacteria bacterium]